MGVKGLASFLRDRAGRLAVLGSGASLVKRRFVSICTITGSSVCVSPLSKALWVKRLARWVGAGGNGMCEGLWVFEKVGRQKTKNRQETRAA
ncbi:hypothetical protein [Limnohabitans sp.]|uniref:hypothetical protein n=1 Tax=Limnohabitans sp. TaxID=1907725 RepID=UPI0025C08C78|nr:hypothetical protein [Limnohabitans sp.]